MTTFCPTSEFLECNQEAFPGIDKTDENYPNGHISPLSTLGHAFTVSGWQGRAQKWLVDLLIAFHRAMARQTWHIKVYLIIYVIFMVYGGWIAIGTILTIFPVVSATTPTQTCSAVHVTIPGPILTVSIINGSYSMVSTVSNAPAPPSFAPSIVTLTTLVTVQPSIMPPPLSTVISKFDVLIIIWKYSNLISHNHCGPDPLSSAPST